MSNSSNYSLTIRRHGLKEKRETQYNKINYKPNTVSCTHTLSFCSTKTTDSTCIECTVTCINGH